ncbi:hypothetical protein [Flavobacterium cellulosilyticum]|uniref:hypothetical protein n=1 Tax=Flavobacterium cellulosilyticum TaxID=2541731 RepID=UPI0038B2C8C4
MQYNGRGNKDEYLKPFKRLHPQKNFVGSGLGSASCRKIVEKHLGEFWVNIVKLPNKA